MFHVLQLERQREVHILHVEQLALHKQQLEVHIRRLEQLELDKVLQERVLLLDKVLLELVGKVLMGQEVEVQLVERVD
jgi:hypothetical protein